MMGGGDKDKRSEDEKWINVGPGFENIRGGGAETNY